MELLTYRVCINSGQLVSNFNQIVGYSISVQRVGELVCVGKNPYTWSQKCVNKKQILVVLLLPKVQNFMNGVRVTRAFAKMNGMAQRLEIDPPCRVN